MTSESDQAAARASNGMVTAASGSVREALSLAAPMVISYLSFSLMGTVDALIMGRVGTAEQGAVGLGAMLAWGIPALFTGTVTAVNTFVAQDFGAGEHHRVRRRVYSAFLLIPFFVAAVWSVVPLFPTLFRLMGVSADVAPHVRTYLSIRLLGVPFLFCTFAVVSFLRGLGNMRTPMAVTVFANVLNAALAMVLVFGLGGAPRLGVAGAAIATVLAGGCEAAIYLAVFFSKRSHQRYQTRTLRRPALRELTALLRIGLPIGLAFLFDMASWTLFSMYAATKAPAALAAHMIVFQIMHYSFLPVAAMSVAATTLVGQYLGAARPDLAHRSALSVIKLSLSYMSACGLTMIVLRHALIRLFNADPEVGAYGASMLILAGLFQPFDAAFMSTNGALRGAGDTRAPMAVMFLSGCLVFLPGVYLFGQVLGLGVVGAWRAAVLHGVFTTVLMAIRFRTGKWRELRV